MSAVEVHQLLAGFNRFDAISLEALALRRIFRELGHPSEIWTEVTTVGSDERREVRDVRQLRAVDRAENLLLLHLSSGSAVNDIFAAARGRKILLYHNITPARYLRPINARFAASLEWGRRQMLGLAGRAELNLADSRFNADELAAAGYGEVSVFPLILDMRAFERESDARVHSQLADGLTNILYVGRGAPNKRYEDLLLTFDVYHKRINPHSRLVLVGSFGGTERYYHYLHALTRRLDLWNVEFRGAIPVGELVAAYRSASLWLGMSEHEGFCVPLLEAAFFGLPVLAYAGGAVAETLGGAGVLFREKEPALVAEMMDTLVRETAVRRAVVERQRARLRELTSGRDVRAEVGALLARLAK